MVVVSAKTGPKKASKKPGRQMLRGKSTKSGKGKKSLLKFVIDCSHPVEDGIFNCTDFESYLRDRIKVNGKLKNFGKEVSLEREKNKIVVSSSVPFSKRYLKYLAKKYMKKNNLRDWLRIVASGADSYELRYFNINNDDDGDDDDDVDV
uniref:Large ribosomal subunit protein eL22 n=2 Tax=Caligus rogercresseyi TaxID=217165 RepID=C1BMD1_CALRO|nr:60S ribosomal protein L22 [Caligus rogercresseyi]ACO11040.1 60S ribosomal protein L22 [Caligus rogercresseyi]|eukprot:TRINITY_DN237_c0_g1_i1.p1 TRINITY_DN237_c0_g1~~TRINITY_DN237_c0_g1_i1.p1  ORF type:complete len:149 (-),score=80.98 TRINITY_DN237_c0_g1_i1:74-520(-)